MDRNNRPRGRDKHVTGGGGDVHKRGGGLNLGGPVGNRSGYSDRGGNSGNSGSSWDSNSQRYSDSGSGNRGSSGGGGNNLIFLLLGLLLRSIFGKRANGRRGGFGSVMILLVIIVGGYLLFTSMMSVPANNYQQQEEYAGQFQQQTPYTQPEPVTNSHPSTSLDTTVASEAREKRTVLRGGGRDTVTVMVYLCGTDLESRSGMATSDLQEMLNATISDNVNLIIETGGTKQWKNSVISNRTNQIYQITEKGLLELEPDLGKKAMTDPATLSHFIQYCRKNYPADRYGLILWDHGGGSQGGYGYDENYPGGTMTLDKLYEALENGGSTFDFIGFDACLMATMETAMVLEPFADYMIASEETEPGTGWYYTNWLSNLSQNTSIPTVELGKRIIDDFVAASSRQAPNQQTTLSLVDLAEFKGTVPQAFSAFSKSTTELINSDEYQVVSNARSNAKEFAKSAQINQVDLIHLAKNIKTPEGKTLAEALKRCVKYNVTSRSVNNAYGISIYFPYGKLGKLDNMLSTYKKIGLDSEYSKCITSFANAEAGGQMSSTSSGSPLGSLFGSLLGGEGGYGGAQNSSSQSGSAGSQLVMELLNSCLQNSDFGNLSGITSQNSGWLDQRQIMGRANYYAENRFPGNQLTLRQKNGGQVVSLTEEQWDLIQNVELNVFVDDGEGYIDLGLDNTFSFDDDGDLLMDYDRTWLALNGQVVSYYFLSQEEDGDSYTITGRVPAMLNGSLVDLMLVFNNENPYGVVEGARINYDGKVDAEAKGLIKLKDGDKLDFLCDYYGYDESFKNNYYLGEPMVVTGDIMVSNVNIGAEPYKAAYRLTDIYYNHHWTPSISR